MSAESCQGGNQIGNKAHLACYLARDDRSLGDATDGSERGFNLIWLDAEAAYFDLLVGPAEKLKHAIGTPAGEVACAVHSCPRRPKRAGDETLRGQAGIPKISPG
jgi:hypothetical protein